jgi:DNA modification methylase
MLTQQECRIGDARKLTQEIPSESIDTIITSPPYWGLRDYGVEGQIGLEPTLGEYHEQLLKITAELYRILKPTGVMFWNHGDSYGANKSLDLQNSRLIIKMIDTQDWILRNHIMRRISPHSRHHWWNR